MDKKYVVALLTVVMTVLLSPFDLRAQDTEEDKIKDAAAAFDKQDYAKAFPLYSQLLSLRPNDPNYNYRFGVCMLYANADKSKALPFLETASKDPKAEVDVWFYLGRAYHLNYRFDEAIVAYNKYKAIAGEKKAEKMHVDNQVAMCKTGKKLLKAVTDITVLEKKELSSADFFRSYDLSGYSGELLVKGDEFKTNLDRKKNETSIIFLSGEKNVLYFSSYGDNEENGKDIYRVVRLPNGGWSKPYNVGYPINTEYDEDYPFLHPNGKVLYFSSKGHNSMGGYDIFRAELNEDVGSWLKPANMDFPINSPDDDILFVTDFDEKTAWFASARNSPQGQMMVYHVMIQRRPVNALMITGIFKPTSVDPNAGAKITVRNEETNQPVGVYKSNDKTGAYVINLPNAEGKYTFTVEKSGIHTQTKTVFVPPQSEIKPIRQEIFYTETAGEQDLNIVTYFDDDTAQFAPDFLKDKANLDISTDDPATYEVVDLGNPGDPKSPVVNPDPTNPDDTGTDVPGGGIDPADSVPSSQGAVSTQEAINEAYADADQTKKDATTAHQQADRAYTYAEKVNQHAKDKQAEADKAQAAADAMPEGPEKVAAQDRAKQLQAEANALQSQTVAAVMVAESLTEDANQKDKEAKAAEEYAVALEAGSKKTGPNAMDEANTALQALNDISNTRSQGEEASKNLQEQADTKREQLQAAKSKRDDILEEKKSNEELMNNLRADSAKEKDPDLREGYATQIEAIQESIDENNADLKKQDQKIASLQNDVNDLDHQAQAAKDVLIASKDPSIAPVEIAPEKRKELKDDAVAYENRVEDSNNPVVVAPVQPKQTDPVVSDPKNPDPVVSDPKNPDPVVGDPKNPDPVVGDPKNPGPVVSDPKNPDPVVGDPKNPDPVVGDPKNPDPVVSDPKNPDPIVDDPKQPDPVASDPITPATDVIADVQGGVSERIQEAENETDPVKREEMIGEAHRQAEKDVGDKVATAESQLQNEKDPSRQKELQDKIDRLKEEEKRQHDLAAQSDQRASDATTAVQPKDPFEEYSDAVAAANTMSDPVAREKAKGDAYTEWANALDQKAAEDKKLLGTLKSKDSKDSLKQVIAQEEAKSKELKLEAKEAKAAEQKAVAEQNSPGAKSDRVFDSQIADASANPDPVAREEAKETIYESWADSLNTEADKLDQLAAKERNPKRKEEYQARAQDLRTSADDKTRLAQDAKKASADAAIASQPKQPDLNPEPIVPADAVVEEGVTYSDPESKDAITERNQLQQDAEASRRKQDSLIAAAGNADGDVKTQLLSDASQAQREAWDKEAEASAAQGEANDEQFASNATALDGYKAGASGKDNAKVETAGLLADESATLMERAKTKRAEAKLATSPYQRNEALKEAEDLEQQAIIKQQQAIAMYQQEGVQPSAVAIQPKQPDTVGADPKNPDPVVADPKNPDPVVADPKNPDPVVTDPKNPDPVVTDPKNPDPVVGDPKQPEPSTQRIINPSTGDPFTSEQVDQIRGTQEYKDYVALDDQAIASENDSKRLQRESDQYQDSASRHIEMAQEYALRASDQSDPAKKREYLDKSKTYNEQAKRDIVARDSTKELAEERAIDAKTKRAQADSYINGLDQQTSSDVKAIAENDPARSKNPQVEDPNARKSDPIIVDDPNTPDPVVGDPITPDPVVSDPINPDPVVSEPKQPEPLVVQPKDPADVSRVGSQLKAGEQFRITSQPNTNPIPVDQPVPTGIVYKVQIGAFRNPIPVDLFKGIQPLTAESVGNGITRYTAGLFTEFANADAAKREIRAMGYPDAFVVAYKDGKRISIGEARRLQGQSASPDPVAVNPDPVVPGPTQPDPVVVQPKQPQPSATKYEAEATDVKSTQELFYTVQVGVYSRPVSPDRLYNLGGLFSERTANGYIRYACGKYNNVAAANEAKNNIVGIGIKDAFVTAYFEGQRISVERAAELERSGVKPAGDASANIQRNNSGQVVQPVPTPTPQPPVVEQPSPEPTAPTWEPEPAQPEPTQPEPAQPQPTQPEMTPIPVIANTKPNVPDTGLVFSVQLGAYKEFVPIAMANRFLLFASKGVSIYRDVNSELTVYQVGVYGTYKDAQSLKDDAIAKGINDAFIVAWYNGEKIPVEKALELRPQ